MQGSRLAGVNGVKTIAGYDVAPAGGGRTRTPSIGSGRI